jgi:uncharacterized membrane protein YhaH (DUF805 family)
MSTPHDEQDPRGADPYGDANQDQIPGQGGEGAGSQQGGAGNQQSSYSAYPQRGGYVSGNAAPKSYLQGAPVGFIDAARGAFGNIFTYRGRASRSAFWWFVLLEIIAYLIVGFVSNRSTVAGVILDIVVGIPMVLTGISLAVRRLHDADHAGWWWWIGLVPFVGWIVLLIFYLLPGTPGRNRYNFIR